MSSNGEIIHIHVGQAGVQIANACWELYCLEHGINADGCMFECPRDDSYNTFFANSVMPKVVPRAVMIDSEPTVIDEVRTGTYCHLFKPEALVTGREDSGSNFARGYNTLGAELIDITMNAIRGIAEACCNLKGFISFRSIGGGTGSGLGDRIMEQIVDEYGKITKIDFNIFPSPSLSPLIVEPYNSILSTHIGMECSDCTFILDNEALYDICESKLDVVSPTYTNLNRIIGQAVSTMTASCRFYGSTNVSLAEFQTNLVPFPRIHFPLVSYAPLVTVCNSYYTELNTEQLTLECFHPASQLVRCNPAEGKYMSCVLLYRGNVAPVDINTSIRLMKSKEMLEFVNWSPTGFKIGINSMPPYAVPGGDIGPVDRAIMGLTNNTIIQKAWCRLLVKFNKLFRRRTFLHHFASEGIEEDLFLEASEDICSLIQDYKEVEGSSSYSSDERIRAPAIEKVESKSEKVKAYEPDVKRANSDIRVCISEGGRPPVRLQATISRGPRDSQQSDGDKASERNRPSSLSSKMSLLDKSKQKQNSDHHSSGGSSRINCHFHIYSDCSTNAEKSKNDSSTEVSRTDCHFQIQDGVCKVLDSQVLSDQEFCSSCLADEVSHGVATINCFVNLAEGTCTCTTGTANNQSASQNNLSAKESKGHSLPTSNTQPSIRNIDSRSALKLSGSSHSTQRPTKKIPTRESTSDFTVGDHAPSKPSRPSKTKRSRKERDSYAINFDGGVHTQSEGRRQSNGDRDQSKQQRSMTKKRPQKELPSQPTSSDGDALTPIPGRRRSTAKQENQLTTKHLRSATVTRSRNNRATSSDGEALQPRAKPRSKPNHSRNTNHVKDKSKRRDKIRTQSKSNLSEGSFSDDNKQALKAHQDRSNQLSTSELPSSREEVEILRPNLTRFSPRSEVDQQSLTNVSPKAAELKIHDSFSTPSERHLTSESSKWNLHSESSVTKSSLRNLSKMNPSSELLTSKSSYKNLDSERKNLDRPFANKTSTASDISNAPTNEASIMREHMAMRRKLNIMTKIPPRIRVYKRSTEDFSPPSKLPRLGLRTSTLDRTKLQKGVNCPDDRRRKSAYKGDFNGSLSSELERSRISVPTGLPTCCDPLSQEKTNFMNIDESDDPKLKSLFPCYAPRLRQFCKLRTSSRESSVHSFVVNEGPCSSKCSKTSEDDFEWE